MATVAVSASAAVLKPVIEKLSSEVWKNVSMFWRLDKKCGKLKEELTKIEIVLDDAEKKSITNELIRQWLWKLQDIAFDIEDFLDGLQEAQRREQNKSKSPVGKMQVFFSSDNQLKFHASMDIKLNKISKRLGKIIEERKKYELVVGHVLMEEDQIQRETNAAVIESELYGRKEEKEKLIDLLIRGNRNAKLSVLALVGMGGVGKTTLAQMIYNDPKIKKHFFQVIWVHVPMNFELKEILRKLIECISGKKCDVLDEEPMKNKLQTLISGNNFFLVLDDVWNENATKWNGLRIILNCGGLKSKILVTTRSEGVAEIMGAYSHFHVNPLDFEHCWELFKRRAFPQMNEHEMENAALVKIGKEIVRKCKGLPLAAEHLGNLAGRLRSIQFWSAIQDNELWQIEEDYKKEVRVVPSLLLSYFYLPSHLKRCFAYCSLFPKGFLFEKERMIQLWTCEGFIPKMEIESNSCFDYLLSRSFFEKSEKKTWDRCKYRMHDLIHDLSCYVAGDKFFLRSECENSQNTVSWRYSSIWLNDTVKIKKLRSLIYRHGMDLGQKLDSIMLLHCLRVLDLAYCEIKVLPDSIGNLKHLRYFNISHNYDLEMLPNALTSLINLQVLDLLYCDNLNELPVDLGALENLEVLNLYRCSALEVLPTSLCSLTNLRTLDLTECLRLASIPKGLGNLTKLERLPHLIIGGEEGCTIGELRQLDLLENNLQIVVKEAWGLQDISTAKLGAKQYLKSLEIQVKEGSSNVASFEVPPQLKNLYIWSKFYGFDLPSTLRTTDFPFKYRNLVGVVLHKINECDCFPQFGKLPKLKILDLSLQFPITKLKEQFSGKCGIYPVLKELYLRQYSWEPEPAEKVEETEAMQEMFPCLKTVQLNECPFTSVFAFLPRSIENLNIKGDCGEQILSEQSMQGLDQLRELIIQSLPTKFNVFERLMYPIALQKRMLSADELVYLPPTLPGWVACLPSLRSLLLFELPTLQNLPSGIEHLASLQELRILNCPELSKHYRIRKCEDGEVYYKKEEGGDWYDISHIPDIHIRPISVVNKDGDEIEDRKY